MLQHALGLLTRPQRQWHNIRYQIKDSTTEFFIFYLLVLAAIPPVSLLIGVTHFGWQNFDGSMIYLEMANAFPLALMLYMLLLFNIIGIAFAMYKLEQQAGGQADFERCLVFATFTAFPLLVSGAVGLVPIAWLDILIVCCAGLLSTRLLFTGMPIFLDSVAAHRPILASIILLCALALLALSTAIILSLWSIS